MNMAFELKATRLADIAPGSAYAVEVTSISALPRPVMVARADHSTAAIHSKPARASAIVAKEARSVVTGASSCVLMGASVRGTRQRPVRG